MNIKFLRCREDYDKWLAQRINPDGDTAVARFLSQVEVDAAFSESPPRAYPCLVYLETSENNCLDEKTIYVYEDEFSEWIHLMGL
ncbi:hypothetical protein [Rahnella selenatireducens]|uniref:hypothetical protein n=1 Tax=Rahnella selenatireducens TaxID=3389797 RepID=UPI003967E6C0